jgi:hypothetical protein
MPGMVYDPAHASRASVRSFEWSGRELNGFQRVGVDTRPHDVAVLAAMRDVKDEPRAAAVQSEGRFARLMNSR